MNEKEEEILIDSQVKASPVLIVRKRLFSNKINRQKVEKVDYLIYKGKNRTIFRTEDYIFLETGNNKKGRVETLEFLGSG